MYKKTLKYRVSVGILGISISQKVVQLLECSKGHMEAYDYRHIKCLYVAYRIIYTFYVILQLLWVNDN